METSFGIVPQQEMLYEFWLPEYADDFRVEMEVGIHSSFQQLRVDTRIELPESADPDFDHDGLVDGADFLLWQRSPGLYSDVEGLDQWKQNYGTTASLTWSSSIPEPSTLTLLAIPSLSIFIRRYR